MLEAMQGLLARTEQVSSAQLKVKRGRTGAGLKEPLSMDQMKQLLVKHGFVKPGYTGRAGDCPHITSCSQGLCQRTAQCKVHLKPGCKV